VYCSHNLEHYYHHEVPRVLAGSLHVLKPHGFAEIRVPDVEAVCR
jgi:predicted SAM-dependent methyltransferase